ncbi:hypothetical protein Tco_0931101 [Tanacetum coccineum]
MSSPNRSTSNIEDAFSSMNILNYTSVSSDYFPASSGSSSFNSSENSTDNIIPPVFSSFYNNPYLKDVQAFYAKELPIPSPDPITSPAILTPSPVLPPSLLFDPRYFFVPEELLPPKKRIRSPSSSSTTLSNSSQNQKCNLVSPSFSVYTPTPPQVFEIGKCSDKMYLKHHEKQIEDILNYLDELSLHRIDKMKKERTNDRMTIRRDGNKLKIKLKRIRTQIIKLQKKRLGKKDKIAFAHYKISDLEQIIEKIQARHQTRPHPHLPWTIGSQPIPSFKSQDDVVTYAINSLSEKYGSLAQIIAHKEPFLDLSTVRLMVFTEEMRIQNKSPSLSYATEVLERAGMLTCNPCRTPVDTDSKLAAAGDPCGGRVSGCCQCSGRDLLVVQYQRTKHIEIDIHFVRDLVTTGHYTDSSYPSVTKNTQPFNFFVPKELLTPKKRICSPSSSSTTLPNPSRNQTCDLISPSSSVYTSTLPQIFEIGKCSDKMYLKHHEKQVKDILNYLDKLYLHRIEKMEE